MVMRPCTTLLTASVVLVAAPVAVAQDAGSIAGVVYDRSFESPIADATVRIVELEDTQVTTDPTGNYSFGSIPAGTYTLVFAGDGYTSQVVPNVLVSAGSLQDVDVFLVADFVELDTVVVEDFQLESGTEADLLELRAESPALIDAISAEFIGLSGASDAASALQFVAGASVQDGKFAVIRGLPDRYVNSQINGIRFPTADEDKRAVQLDQFPSAVIESIQVSKTFTPDQQGDASGGAVNVLVKGIPNELIVSFSASAGYNSNVSERADFLTYQGGGVNLLGDGGGERDRPVADEFGMFDEITDTVGVSRGQSPTDYKWSFAIGGMHEFEGGLRIGGFATMFYERDSAFYEDGVDDSYWVRNPGEGLEPETTQGTPEDGDFKTALFDITKGTESVQWGGLGTFGVETDNHSIGLTYLYTRVAEDTATLAEDTRGREYYFPNYDPNDPEGPGNNPDDRDAAPYIRTETLEYTERTTETLQWAGSHVFPIEEFGITDVLEIKAIELDWSLSNSTATLYQPDKRQFGALWRAPVLNPGVPPFLPPFLEDPEWRGFKPAAVFTLGNFQRIWKDIEEKSDQYALNIRIPFEQWTGDEGYIKFGVFDDEVTRSFDQDTYSNFNDNSTWDGDWEDYWTLRFPTEGHPLSDGPPYVDVDYEGKQKVSAYYWMVDLPVTSWASVIGGVRYETTEIGIVNFPEDDAMWFPEGAISGVALDADSGDADVDFEQRDELPSISLVLQPVEPLVIRAAYSETVARQTYKELTPIQQQEFLGGDIFIGNPGLQMSAVKNYDLRLDWTPSPGSLFSVSWFEKDITAPIEYVQRVADFTYTTAVNYPSGTLSGYELEVRQDMGVLWDRLQGLTLGANATFIDSEVQLTAEEIEDFASPAILAPITSRHMTNAPEHLYNLYMTYDIEATQTSLSLFYTVRGDTLIAGAGESEGNFVPSVYETEYDSLNFKLSQKLGPYIKLSFSAKNLTNPKYESVYRSQYIGEDVLKTSYTKGIDYSIGLSAEFKF